MIVGMQIYVWLAFVFVVGACVGSFLNVAIARLPLEKSLIWPGSRCGKCFQRVRWYDNIPVLGYLWLWGRCRSCGEKFSLGYLGVELLAGLGFAGLFHVEVVHNFQDAMLPIRSIAAVGHEQKFRVGAVHGWPVRQQAWELQEGFFPAHFFIGFGFHAILFSFLLAVSACDLRCREIPFSITLTGTLVGLVGSALLPWPWPWAPEEAVVKRGNLVGQELWMAADLPEGVFPWPLWGPLPEWLPPGSWQLGLATGLAGALMGTFLLRAIGFVFSAGLGKEGLGMGDADLMMMAGSFLGWQLVVVGFFLSVVPALFFGIFNLVVRRDSSLPFGPSLAAGTLLACLCWRWLGPPLQPLLFWGTALLGVATAGAVILLVSSLSMRLLRMLATRG